MTRTWKIDIYDVLNRGRSRGHDQNAIRKFDGLLMSWVTDRIVFFSLCQIRTRSFRLFSFCRRNGGILGCRCADAESLRYHADADALTRPESCARFDRGAAS